MQDTHPVSYIGKLNNVPICFAVLLDSSRASNVSPSRNRAYLSVVLCHDRGSMRSNYVAPCPSLYMMALLTPASMKYFSCLDL